MLRFRPLAAIAAGFTALLIFAAPAAAEPALWRLADEDTEMFLFGSVHILPGDAQWRGAALDAAFEGADVLVLETDLDTSAHGAANRLAEANTYLPEGRRLTDLLSEAEAARLGQALRSVGMAPDSLAGMRPWMASLVLSLRFALSQGQDPEAGVDRVLAAEAGEAGKDILFLEAPEDQIAAFVGLSRAAEIAMLTSTVDEMLDRPDVLEAMDEAWLAGDVEALDALTGQAMRREAPELYETAMVGRNHAWAPALAELMGPPGRVLVVVGAAHLAGPDGLPALLSEQGFAVERVR